MACAVMEGVGFGLMDGLQAMQAAAGEGGGSAALLALVVALAAFALGRSEFRQPPWTGRFTIGGVVLGVGLILLAWLLHAPWC